jgi:hypothetical protein
MKKQRKAREYWVAIYQSQLGVRYGDTLLTYSTRKAAIDCNDKESVFKVREVLPKRKSK